MLITIVAWLTENEAKNKRLYKILKRQNQLDPTVIPKEQVKKTDKKVAEVEETVKKTGEEVIKVQNFQRILEELRDEYKKGEWGWFWASVLIAPVVFVIFYILIVCLKIDFQTFYPLYIFSSAITFFVIRQYINAKQLRVEASNRLAMAKMFEKIQQTEDNQNYKDFIPKIIDSIAYSMRKNQKESIPIDEILKHLKK